MSENKPTPAKLKIICRVQDGRYTEELRVDNVNRKPPYSDAENRAFALLHSFSPEERTRALCREKPDSVLVFRTDAAQIAEFETLLNKRV